MLDRRGHEYTDVTKTLQNICQQVHAVGDVERDKLHELIFTYAPKIGLIATFDLRQRLWNFKDGKKDDRELYLENLTNIEAIDLVFGLTQTEARRVGNCSGGFEYDEPGTLYYLHVETATTPLYKIGITNLSVRKRFCLEDLEKITVLQTTDYQVGRDAYDMEQFILHIFAEYRYVGTNKILLSGGDTELFTIDVLGLDK